MRRNRRCVSNLHLESMEVTTDIPGLTQFNKMGQLVIQTAWVS